jgi:hypothetical protein
MRLKLLYVFFLYGFLSCNGQKPFGLEHLQLDKTIEMPGVSGRIDHMAFNLKDQVLYVAALGNNSVEVVDLQKGTVIKSIKGIEEPQGIAFIPEQNEIVVASGGNGDCVFLNAGTFENISTIHLDGDADNIRFDAAERKIFVGYGNGAMALIDPISHKHIRSLKLAAHPESFQLDKKNNKIYVNLPDAHSISVIDLKTFSLLDSWKIDNYKSNFPMTLDTSDNLVFIGYRRPAKLVSYDAKNGNQISTNELVGDIDDIFYYTAKQQIIASGGDGWINIFQREADKTYKQVANIPSRGGARTSLLIPSLNLFIIAERANGGKPAAIVVYKIKD